MGVPGIACVNKGQIADMFGGVSFSATIMKDKAFRITADKISRKMAYVKG